MVKETAAPARFVALASEGWMVQRCPLWVLLSWLLVRVAIPASALEQVTAPTDRVLVLAEDAALRFVQRRMLDARRAPHTRVALEPGALAGELPGARSVLSESVGLLMTYAALADARPLFDAQLRLAERVLQGPHGLLAWRASRHLARTDASSASIDDLTVVRALLRASARWDRPDLARSAAAISTGILEHQVVDGVLVDAASWNGDGIYSGREVQLAYLDLRTMALLAERDAAWEPAYESGLRLLREGGDGHGLFAETWSLDSGEYATPDPVNGILAAYCALHLAEVGEGGAETLALFDARLADAGRLAGRYGRDDRAPVDGYEAAAVYALAARLSLALGQIEPAERYVARLLETQKSEPRGAAGAFSLGNTAHTFDNLHALIAVRSLRLARAGRWGML